MDYVSQLAEALVGLAMLWTLGEWSPFEIGQIGLLVLAAPSFSADPGSLKDILRGLLLLVSNIPKLMYMHIKS